MTRDIRDRDKEDRQRETWRETETKMKTDRETQA